MITTVRRAFLVAFASRISLHLLFIFRCSVVQVIMLQLRRYADKPSRIWKAETKPCQSEEWLSGTRHANQERFLPRSECGED